MNYNKMFMRNLMTVTAIKTHSGIIRSTSTILLCLLLAVNSWALESDRQQPIDVTADRSELDARTGFTRIIGSVVIRQGSLEVNADDAEVYVESGRVTRVLLNGAPATWRQQLDSLEWMDARAAEIDYQVNDATILLTGDATVNHPQGQITGDKLTYDLDAEKLRGDSNAGGRVRIRLDPDIVENDAADILQNTPLQPAVDTPADDASAADDDAAETDNGN